MAESEYLFKTACPSCGSSDANAVYSDGHTFCFSCGSHGGDNSAVTPAKRQARALIEPVVPVANLSSRGLTPETVARFGVGYNVGKNIEPALVFPYYDAEGTLVAQKVRNQRKEFHVLGNLRDAELFGSTTVGSGGRLIVVTEGELDAMAVDQAMVGANGRRYGAVSVPNGASGAKKSLTKVLDWLCKFETVVLCFDMDEPGREAVAECVELFPPGKAAIAVLPLKDACDMLSAGRAQELVSAIWNAKPHVPGGIVTVADIHDKVLTPPTKDLSWCLPALDEAAYGRRFGECVGLGAGTGVGKTTLMTQQIAADLRDGHAVGVFALEASPQDTVKRVLGQMHGRSFHVPNSGWTQAELEAAVSEMERGEAQLFLYDHFGVSDWDTIRERIRWLNKAHGVRVFYLDHLTALAANDPDNERQALERIMGEIGGLVKELDVWLLFVSHLSTPDKGAHEEGARVAIRHFKGSRMIGAWAAFIIALERDQQAEDANDRRLTTLRVLKDRFTGQALGLTVQLSYDTATGCLVPADADITDTLETPF